MKRLTLFSVLFVALLFVVPLALAAPPTSCGNVSSVSLSSPSDPYVTGDFVGLEDFVGFWDAFDTPPLSTDCRLELYGSLNFTGYDLGTTANLDKLFTVDKLIFTSNYEEGSYDWNIGCWTNISNSCELIYSNENRTIVFDYSGPTVLLGEPPNSSIVSLGEAMDFNYDVSDTYDSGSMSCSLYVDGVQKLTHAVPNGTNDVFVYTESIAGFHEWYVNCADNYGNSENSSLRIFSIDNSTPIITILNPEDNLIVTTNNTVTFNFTVEDVHDPNNLSCEIFIEDSSEQTMDVLNGSNGEYNHTFATDGDYSWYVSCEDTTHHAINSTTRNVSLSVGADIPILWELPLVTNESVLFVSGYSGKPGTVNLTIVNDDYPMQRTNTTPTESSNYTTFLGNLTVNTTYNSSFFLVEDNLEGNLTIGNFIKFAGHDFLNFLYYQITGVFTAIDDYKVSVSPLMNQTPQVGEILEVYNYDRPSGWFNVSIELYPGTNMLSIYGSQLGIPGASYAQSIVYDVGAPWLNITNITGLHSEPEINFTIFDEYNVSLETLYVNITNSSNVTDFTIYAVPVTTYNLSDITGNITCVNTTLALRECSLTHELVDGVYNITISVKDSFGEENQTLITNYTLKSIVQPVLSIVTLATTVSIPEIYVNWSASTDEYLDYYELSLRTGFGSADVIAWFELETNYSNYTLIHENISYMTPYFVDIRAVDILGKYSNITSSSLVVVEDNNNSYNNFIFIQPNNGIWVNEPDQLTLNWSFTDDETEISGYEYTIGTNIEPAPGWKDVLTETLTIRNNFTETELVLTEGETYYVSARAMTTNIVRGDRWSDWYSSEGVIFDTQPPANGFLEYANASIDVDFITVSFLVGNDTTSGISHATLSSRKAELHGGSCPFSGTPEYTEILNATIIGSMTPRNFTFTNLENGYCYRFALDVYDGAGNSVRYGTTQVSTVEMDFTPPTPVVITDGGFFTASTDLSFWWEAAQDPESSISYYEYALGTSPGAIDAINWTNNLLAQSIDLTADDYEVGHLLDEEIYYLSVRAWNAHNTSLYSQASSDGILYFDFEIADALSVVSVANDTTADGWFDNTSSQVIDVILQGETGLSCVWSIYDIDYVDQTDDYATGCTEIPGNSTYYNCTVTNMTQGRHDISVVCQDQAGNKQTTASNTDIIIYKDNQLPTMSIISPTELVIPADILFVVLSINETTPYTLEVFAYDSLGFPSGSENHGILSGNEYVDEFDLTDESGEYTLEYVLTDSYNNSINDSITFIINDNESLVTMNLSDDPIGGNFITHTQDVNVKAYFFNNITLSVYAYSVESDEFTLFNMETHTYPLLQNKSEFNYTFDTTLLDDGGYFFVVNASSNISSDVTGVGFIVDTVFPYYNLDSFAEPTEPITEDDNISLYLVWNDDITGSYLTHNASGSFENISVTDNVPEIIEVVAPNMTRYKAVIDSSSLKTSANFVYRWVAFDEAGNTNITPDRTLQVVNRAPIIESDTTFAALEHENFVALISFADADESQHNASFFECSASHANFETTTLSNSLCMINWTDPIVGTYTFNLVVEDNMNGVVLDSDVAIVTVNVLPATTQNVVVDANIPFTIDYFLDEQFISASSSFVSEDIVATIADSVNYTVEVTVPNEVIISATNVTIGVDADVLLRELNIDFIENETVEVGPGERLIPLIAYAAVVNYSTDQDYVVTLFYDNATVIRPLDLQIIKFEYDIDLNTINYSTLQFLSSRVNESTLTVSASTSNFSAFVLVENDDLDGDGDLNIFDCRPNDANTYHGATEICGDGIDNDCSDGDLACPSTGGHTDSSSRSSGGGSFVMVVPDDSCTDGVQNGAETGIDCGGNCEVCLDTIEFSTEPSYCFNGLNDFDEDGVDCGGSCIVQCIYEIEEPVFIGSCTDGIKNQNEEGVDCGGSCAKSCEQKVEPIKPTKPIKEKPAPIKPEKKGLSVMWFILIGMLTVGGILFFVAKTQHMDVFGLGNFSGGVGGIGKITFGGFSDLSDDDVASIARYIEEQQENDISTKAIKKHLINNGYSKENVVGAAEALLRKDYLITVQEYLEKYSHDGFDDGELQNWLLEKGINACVVAIAMDRHRRKQF